MYTQSAHIPTLSYSVSKHIKTFQVRRGQKDYDLMIKAVRRRRGLSKSAIYLYEELSTYDLPNSATGFCKGFIWPGYKELMERCVMTKDEVYNCLEELEREGLIQRKRRQNTSPVIFLLDIPTAELSPYKNERQFDKKRNAINRNKENIINNHNHDKHSEAIQYYEAKCDDVVWYLISFGYTPEQAYRDFVAYGREELEQQIQNLYAYMRLGKPIHNKVKFLNWLIRTKHRITPEVQKEAEQALELAIQKAVRYEQVIDEETNTIHLVEIDELGEVGESGAYVADNPRTPDGGGNDRATSAHASCSLIPIRALPAMVNATRPIFHHFVQTDYICSRKDSAGNSSGTCENESEKSRAGRWLWMSNIVSDINYSKQKRHRRCVSAPDTLLLSMHNRATDHDGMMKLRFSDYRLINTRHVYYCYNITILFSYIDIAPTMCRFRDSAALPRPRARGACNLTTLPPLTLFFKM